jgi:hypothetical protein
MYRNTNVIVGVSMFPAGTTSTYKGKVPEFTIGAFIRVLKSADATFTPEDAALVYSKIFVVFAMLFQSVMTAVAPLLSSYLKSRLHSVKLLLTGVGTSNEAA